MAFARRPSPEAVGGRPADCGRPERLEELSWLSGSISAGSRVARRRRCPAACAIIIQIVRVRILLSCVPRNRFPDAGLAAARQRQSLVRRLALAVVDPVQGVQPGPQATDGCGCRGRGSCGWCAAALRSGMSPSRSGGQRRREHGPRCAPSRRQCCRRRRRVLRRTGQRRGQRRCCGGRRGRSCRPLRGPVCRWR